jgi:TPP-dependent pyruvate/acetoin dehydrogenase alpha subunit
MSDGVKVHLDRAHLHHLYREMLRIRRFEARCVELYQAQKIRGFLHLYDGEEAIAVGVMGALEARDAVVATYREHGQALARGVRMPALMAEMLGKAEGTSRGRGGSMHVFDAATRFFGGNAIVGGGLPLAAGIALADKRLGRGAVTACFFGEGAVGEGVFHETMNLAQLWQLPVLFVCENNLYSMGVPFADADVQTEVWRKAACYRMAADRRSWNAAPTASAPTRCSTPRPTAGATRSTSGARSTIRSSACAAGWRTTTAPALKSSHASIARSPPSSMRRWRLPKPVRSSRWPSWSAS